MRLLLVLCIACSDPTPPAPVPVPVPVTVDAADQAPPEELCERAMRRIADINLDELGATPQSKEMVIGLERPKFMRKCLKSSPGWVSCVASAKDRAALYKCPPGP